MKVLRAKKGPFTERPYYELKDIEAMCIQELQSVGLYSEKPEPIRIDRFVEKRFNLAPEYEDLEDGVLGLTTFGSKGVERIIVTRSLDRENTKAAERRIRTTLAHEAGHGLLHSHLFLLASKQPMLDGFANSPQVLCRDVHTESTEKVNYDGRWWEHQANLVIGTLLLPRPLVIKALSSFISNDQLSNRAKAVLELSEIFNVNPVVAKIRINEICPEMNVRQGKL